MRSFNVTVLRSTSAVASERSVSTYTETATVIKINAITALKTRLSCIRSDISYSSRST